MGASLANGGVNPRTGQRAAPEEYIGKILSLMATCGMYDYAGEWIYRVGIPAKSGVGGGILAVLPGQLGIGVFSPALDGHGNSVRGIAVCRAMSRDFELHLFNAPRVSRSVIRSCSDATQISSRRLRGSDESAILKEHGHRIRIYELQGDLNFASAEMVVRDIVEPAEPLDFAILDLKRVVILDDAASKLLIDLGHNLAEREIFMLFTNLDARPRLLGRLETLKGPARERVMPFGNLDLALEWCEDRLLGDRTTRRRSDEALPLVEHEMCRGLTEDEYQRLLCKMTLMSFAAGDPIVREGEAGDSMYFLVKGEVSVTVGDPSGKPKRVSTLSPGMVFGEMSAIDRRPRSADVRADTDVDCYVLSLEEFDRLGQSDGKLKVALLENLLRHISRMLRRLNEEVSALAR